MQISQEVVKELFDYKNGLLINKVNRSTNSKAGQPAGYIRTDKKTGEKYWIVGINKKRYYAHNLVFLWHNNFTPEWPNVIDHIDSDGTNNKIENLRVATPVQNAINRKKHLNNKSGTTGVYWHKSAKKWSAFVSVNNKRKHLGLFETIEQAIQKRQEIQKQIYGEFAK